MQINTGTSKRIGVCNHRMNALITRRGNSALVRWQHPLDGTVYPDQFIALAEQSGLINGLGQCVLANACSDLRTWSTQGIELQVAINVSMESLMDYGFPDQFAKVLDKHQVEISQICVETTESRLAYDNRMPLDVLARLRLKGFKLSLDDFGTGHSSLARLKDLPFDEMKFDRSFVHGGTSDSPLGVILQSNVEMAKRLGLTTVAEGVEDRDDWRFICDSGIDLAQGYFVAKPMPAEELSAWVEHWQRRLQAEPLVPGKR